jgi:hypothetical protein
MAILSRWLRLLSLPIPTTQPGTWRLPRSNASQFRPAVESLEGRLVPSTVRWTNADGGVWSNPANWSTGAVPGPDDDVVIDMPADVYATTTTAVNSITSQGNVIVNAHATLTLAAMSTFNNLDLETGALSGKGFITVNGTFQWGGPLSGSGAYNPWLAVNGQLVIPDHYSPRLDGRDLDLRGTGTMGASSGLTIHNASFHVWEGATLTVSGGQFGAQFTEDTLWSGSFVNDGQVNVSGPLTVATSYIANSGTIEVVHGGITLGKPTTSNSRIVNSGAIVFDDGASVMSVRANPFTSTGTITGAGSVRLEDGPGSIQGLIQLGGYLELDAAQYDFSLPELDLGQTLYVNDSSLTIGAASVQAGSLLLNEVASNRVVLNGTSVAVGLQVSVVKGLLAANGAGIQADLVVNQGGQVELSDSTLTANAVINESTFHMAGATVVTVGAAFYNLDYPALLSGSGTIAGNLVNEARVWAGMPGQLGQITVTGDYIQTDQGALVVNMTNPNGGDVADQFIVGGTAHLNGGLTAYRMPDYNPAAGDTFHFLSAGAIDGNFTQFYLANYTGPMGVVGQWEDGVYSLVVQRRY